MSSSLGCERGKPFFPQDDSAADMHGLSCDLMKKFEEWDIALAHACVLDVRACCLFMP